MKVEILDVTRSIQNLMQGMLANPEYQNMFNNPTSNGVRAMIAEMGIEPGVDVGNHNIQGNTQLECEWWLGQIAKVLDNQSVDFMVMQGLVTFADLITGMNSL